MIWLLACAGSMDEAGPDVAPVEDAPAEAAPVADGFPGSSEIPDYEPTMGEEVEREARYVVAPFSGGKDLQAVQLVFDDGSHWIRSYRPLVSEFRYIDKRVLVRGRPYVNSPYVQSVGGTHFSLEHIELADGEVPWDVDPTQIPAPPQVRSVDGLAPREGMWVHAVGTLESVAYEGHSHGAVLTLEGGSTPFSLFAPTSFGRELADVDPADWVGREITVLARVWRDGDALKLSHGKVCAGAVESCQMTQDNSR